MNGLALLTVAVAGGLGLLVGIGAANVLLAMTRDDYSDVWDWDDTEEA